MGCKCRRREYAGTGFEIVVFRSGESETPFWSQYRVKNPEENLSTHYLPNFLNDLNAIHEAEKVLDYDQQEDFLLFIGAYNHESDAPWSACHATAAQRCEAFLKTLGLWKETES